MADRVSKEVRSFIMSRIRSNNTGIEKFVFKGLRSRGIYFQRHYRGALGAPDVAIPKKKIAVFIDGDFWHGFRYPTWKKRLGSRFWNLKIERNRARDRRTFANLRRGGWKVMRLWEHEIMEAPESTLEKLMRFTKTS